MTKHEALARPPITAAHRRAAYELLAIKDVSFGQAMRDPFQRRLIVAANYCDAVQEQRKEAA